MDQSLVAETVTKLMDGLDRDWPDGEILAVAVVASVHSGSDDAKDVWTRLQCSDDLTYRQVGLLTMGLRAAQHGEEPDDES